MNSSETNRLIVSLIASHLGDLCQEVVFVGGCAASLLITDEAAPEVRSTTDVDCIVDVISKRDYYKLENRLRDKGFSPSKNVICRWEIEGVKVDVMPTDSSILGFSNRWYKAAILHANEFKLTQDLTIQLVSAPYFLATKYEAFLHRGKEDYYASHDLEDIVAVTDGRVELAAEYQSSSRELKGYLAQVFNRLLANQYFIQALPGHLGGSKEAMRRLPIVLERFKQFTQLD